MDPQVKASKFSAITDLEERLTRRADEQVEQKHTAAPIFTQPLKDLEPLQEGESAYFSARLTPTDDTNMRVEWYLNGKPLKHGKQMDWIGCMYHVW